MFLFPLIIYGNCNYQCSIYANENWTLRQPINTATSYADSMNKCYTTQEKTTQQEKSIWPNFVAQPQHHCRRVIRSTFTGFLCLKTGYTLSVPSPNITISSLLSPLNTTPELTVQMPNRNLISGIHHLQLHSKNRFYSTRNCVEQCHIPVVLPSSNTEVLHNTLL